MNCYRNGLSGAIISSRQSCGAWHQRLPYGHRNDFTTLAEIIGAHGGAGRAARDAFIKAGADVQSDIIAFLKTLRIEDAP